MVSPFFAVVQIIYFLDCRSTFYETMIHHLATKEITSIRIPWLVSFSIYCHRKQKIHHIVQTWWLNRIHIRSIICNSLNESVIPGTWSHTNHKKDFLRFCARFLYLFFKCNCRELLPDSYNCFELQLTSYNCRKHLPNIYNCIEMVNEKSITPPLKLSRQMRKTVLFR